MPIKIVTVEEMRAIEAAADKAGVSYAQMMDTAGRAVADCAKSLLAEYPDPRVVVLVGAGNNGGDGLVAGRLIAEETRATVTFYLLKPRDESDPNFAKVREKNLLAVDAVTDAEQGYRVLRTMIGNADLIIDALLGTGSRFPLGGDIAKLLRQIRQALKDRRADHPRVQLVTPEKPTFGSYRHPIMIAVDLPTGLNADTGELDENALFANETVTFEAAKPGHFTFSGGDAVGVLHVATLTLPEKLPERDSVKRILADADTVRHILPERPSNSNKGTFGKAMIAAGSLNYLGAPMLAAEAAYRVGAGLVTVATPESVVPIVAGRIPEATYLILPDDLGVISVDAASVLRKQVAEGGYTAMLVGPGLGQEKSTGEFLTTLLSPQQKRTAKAMAFARAEAEPASEPATMLPRLVIDADALNLLAKIPDWWTLLPARTILTPHPGEMARLCATQAEGDRNPVQIVQSKRLQLAAESAAKWNAVVVLKGAHTVIADPDGRLAVIPFANAALARAGTGDVLAGAITGLLAQHCDPFDAAVAAAWLHGYAGDLAEAYVGTKASVLASDVIAALPEAIGTVEAAE